MCLKYFEGRWNNNSQSALSPIFVLLIMLVQLVEIAYAEKRLLRALGDNTPMYYGAGVYFNNFAGNTSFPLSINN